MEPDTRTSCYTYTIFQAIEPVLDTKTLIYYAHTLKRIFQGEISSAASLPALGRILNHHPKAIFLHNEVAAMTHDDMLLRNIPEVYDHGSESDSSHYSESSSDSYGAQLLDLADQFAGTQGARPAEANTARTQVMQCLGVVLEEQRKSVRVIGDLAAEMATMAVSKRG